MVLIRIVYWDEVAGEAKAKDIQHTDWIAEAPDTILKIFIERQPNVWFEYTGQSAYALVQRNSDNKWFFGGFNNITLRSLDNDRWEVPIENAMTPRPEVKIGKQITDAQWAIVNSTAWV